MGGRKLFLKRRRHLAADFPDDCFAALQLVDLINEDNEFILLEPPQHSQQVEIGGGQPLPSRDHDNANVGRFQVLAGYFVAHQKRVVDARRVDQDRWKAERAQVEVDIGGFGDFGKFAFAMFAFDPGVRILGTNIAGDQVRLDLKVGMLFPEKVFEGISQLFRAFSSMVLTWAFKTSQSKSGNSRSVSSRVRPPCDRRRHSSRVKKVNAAPSWGLPGTPKLSLVMTAVHGLMSAGKSPGRSTSTLMRELLPAFTCPTNAMRQACC